MYYDRTLIRKQRVTVRLNEAEYRMLLKAAVASDEQPAVLLRTMLLQRIHPDYKTTFCAKCAKVAPKVSKCPAT